MARNTRMGCPEKLLISLKGSKRKSFLRKSQANLCSSQKYEQLQNRSQRKDSMITVKVNSLDAALISEPLSHLLPGTGQISNPAGLL